jgi:hypothetical protein
LLPSFGSFESHVAQRSRCSARIRRGCSAASRSASHRRARRSERSTLRPVMRQPSRSAPLA